MVEQNVDDQDVENHENGVKHDVISEVVEKQKGVEDAEDAKDSVEHTDVADNHYHCKSIMIMNLRNFLCSNVSRYKINRIFCNNNIFTFHLVNFSNWTCIFIFTFNK